MHLNPLQTEELNAEIDPSHEFTASAMLEKVVLVCSALFCVAMELKFILSEGREESQWSKKDPETYHAKALHLALLFLPAECPLAQHIEETYYKGYLKAKMKK